MAYNFVTHEPTDNECIRGFYMHVSVHRRYMCGEEKPTRCHLMIYCSYELLLCFGHSYAHHQEPETILVLMCGAWCW
jgi:hypothetical protein